jgi:hypothetical protein
LGNLVDHAIIVDSNHYGPIEDIQLVLSHMIAAWVAKVKNVYDGKGNRENQNKAVPFR